MQLVCIRLACLGCHPKIRIDCLRPKTIFLSAKFELRGICRCCVQKPSGVQNSTQQHREPLATISPSDIGAILGMHVYMICMECFQR